MKRSAGRWQLQIRHRVVVLLILSWLARPLGLHGAPGAVDSGFGENGRLTVPLGDAANVVACKSDGEMIVGGSFGVARLHPDGSFDTSFGDGGPVTIGPVVIGPVTNQSAAVGALVLQPDGKIVVSIGAAVARLLSSGALDPNFGQGGLAFVPVVSNRNESILALRLQPDGKIVASGIASRQTGGDVAFLGLRFTADGVTDSTFGSGGYALAAFGTSLATCRAVAVQGDGGIVVGGGVFLNHKLAFGLARFTAAGVLDAGFGTGGEVIVSFAGANFSQINDLALQSDGRIIAAGVTTGTNAADFALARLNPDGSLDHSFGNQGILRTDFSHGSSDIGVAVAVLPDDRIIVAGSTGPSLFKRQFALARYNSDGSLDGSFGQGGLVSTQFPLSHNDVANALALVGDGRIILAGSSPVNDGTNACGLVRYHVNDLAVLEMASSNLVAVGDTLAYSILVENDRLQAVTGVRLTDQLPSSVHIQSAVATQGTCTTNGDLVVCDLGSLASGDQVLVTIDAALHATAHLCNSVVVSANETDPVWTNSASACATLDPAREQPQNLAVTAIRAPARVRLTAAHPETTLAVAVEIQNRSPHAETITDLTGVVDLEVRSLSNLCPDLVPVLLTEPPQARLPIRLASKAKLLVYFNVRYSQECVPDPLETTRSEDHNDYEYVATAHQEMVNDNRDTFPKDDACPRAPVGKVTTAGGTIKDLGCGGRKPLGGLGAPVVTDVIVK